MLKNNKKQSFLNIILTGIILFVALPKTYADDFNPLEYEGFVETESNVIILDSDNDATTSINLQFWETLNKNLSFDITNNWFNLNDSLEINGDLNLQGNLNLNQNQAQNFVFENLATAPTTPVEGQIYYDTTDQINYFWDWDSWEKLLSGETGLITMSALQVRRTTDMTLTNQDEWYDITFNQTDIESNSGALLHNTSNTERIEIGQTGLYKISYQADSVDDAENHRLETRVVINGSDAAINGSYMVNYDFRGEHVPHSGNFMAYLNAGSYITFQAQRLSANLIVNETTFTIIKLETGAQGPQGIQGIQGLPGADWTGAAIFGTEFYETSDETESSTTSTTYQQKLRLNVTNVPAGKYRLGWSYEWQHRNTSNDFRGRVQMNDSTTLMEHQQESQDAGSDQYIPTNWFTYLDLTAGSYFFDIDYNSSSNGRTSGIRRAKLEFWKVEN